MFTGIVEELGAVESIESRPAGARLKIHCQKVLADMTEGASIAVNGVCLTAVDLTAECLAREALGDENWWLKVRVPAELDPYLVYKGSVAIDGISLTIAA